ncbi:MAG: aminoglycoside 6-adenylyltransferase [Chloroflexi bacterium]|nr:aminoglycoside 6-adenylyltransferase [Chloroflexota bacterium]
MSDSLNVYRESRDNLLSRIVQVISNDERFVAAWLTGSFSRNDADDVSDLDLNLVVSDSYSVDLCKRVEQISQQTTRERLDLFSQFGRPAVIHENNYNAPEGGTFTFTLYEKSHLMVDWILIPQSKASRPSQVYLLFEKSSVPIVPPAEPESLEQRLKRASERVAFFWMMMAITAKYIIRRDGVFVTQWLEILNEMSQEIERLIAGKVWEYKRGSRSMFEPTSEGQKQAIYKLGEQMESILPELIKIGGQVSSSPMPEIKALLKLTDDK